MRFIDLHWLPELSQASTVFTELSRREHVEFSELVKLAGSRLDFIQTNRLDRILQKHATRLKADDPSLKPLRLAILSSSTVDHLLPGLRIAALRRGILLETFLGDYGQYLQELQDDASALTAFAPNIVLCAFQPQHVFGTPDPGMPAADAQATVDAACEQLTTVWRRARERFKAQVIQQTFLPTATRLVGSNEHRLRGSGAALVSELNTRLRAAADAERVDLLDLGAAVAHDGLAMWHDVSLWHRAKQEVALGAGPAYGELALRLVAAQRGRSGKCLVLDLDNTLWGGVIGDDGLEGIKLGQGSALGEAFVSFQQYARDLSRRGVILAVCSKNDLENARAPFEKHPEMVLKMADIACFVANWSDKAGNLRSIAEQLNIGIDSLVFADDNPFERNIVRRELPMVAVPELPEEPALYAQCIADGGYFEALQVTSEDFERTGQYRANSARENLKASHTDLAGYLRSLNMVLRWEPFDRIGQQRIVQLINKTNQFNLTTRRYTDIEVAAVMEDPAALTLQLRLLDQFGDNGIIGIIIGKPDGADLRLDTWLMSCRVLGRQVEEASMNLVAQQARQLGARALIGEYLPTKKNGMVKDHYRKLKFSLDEEREDGSTRWRLDLATYDPFPTFISTERSEHE
jgi:FkbH-like protein